MDRPLAAAALAVVTLAAGCGGEETTGPRERAATGASKEEEALKLGDKTTLEGLNGDIEVQVLEVEDPIEGITGERPRKGRRFVGVHVRLTNVSDEPYEDAPLNGSRLVTTVEKGSNPTILLSSRCPSKFGTSLRIAPGRTREGCLPFQVKRKAKLRAFQFQPDSGFGPEMGEWALR